MGFAALRVLRLAACAVVAFASPALAETYLVMKDGSGDALTIAGGVALATAGDSVLVGPGTYFEEVTIDASLTLLSRDGPDVTTVDAQEGDALGNRCVYSSSQLSDLVIQGFRFTDANFGYGFGAGSAVAGFGSLTMSDCQFHDNGNALLWAGEADLDRCEGWEMNAWLSTTFSVGGEARFTDCSFHDMGGGVISSLGGPLLVENCVFRNIELGEFPYAVSAVSSETLVNQVTVQGCVFQDLAIGGVGPYIGPVISRLWGTRGNAESYSANVLGCTFSGVDGGAIRGGIIPGDPSVTIHEFSRNVVTDGLFGVIQSGPPSEPGLYVCNNVWANGSNWDGLSDPTGQEGNLAVPPLFCDAAHGNLTVALNSPCLPQNNGCGVLIGALPQGCGPLSLQSESWGVIKSKYRRSP